MKSTVTFLSIPAFSGWKIIPGVLVFCGVFTLAHAQSTADVNTPTLKVVVVSGSRSEQSLDELPMSMEVVNQQALEEKQIGDIKELAADMPNVSVKHAPARFTVTGAGNPTGRDGNTGFTIRGLGGNRVLMLVDGIRLPRSYVNGNNAFGRDALSLDLVKRVELVRGPSSVLYGSDGLAGMVNFITYEPIDFLATDDGEVRNLGGRVAAGWSGDDDTFKVATTVAGRASETLQWLVTATTQRGQALNNMGTNDAANVDRTRPNPQNTTGDSLLAKLVARPDGVQKHILTVEHVNKNSDVELLTSRVKPPLVAASVVGENARQNLSRDRITWDAHYALNAAWADHLQTVLSLQNSDAQDNGRTTRNDGKVRVRDTTYAEHAWQASVQANKTLPLSREWSQKITYGLDYTSTEITSWFGGYDPAPLTAYVPKKYFPDSRDSSIAAYAQSEFGSERWRVTPGLRLESFALDVISQAGYAPPATAPGLSISGFNASPKLGALYQIDSRWAVYGNYASGFKAPNATQLNGYFDPSPGINARLLPNPNLKSETSQNFELGVRTRFERLSLEVAAFTGRYNQLIVDKKLMRGSNTVADPYEYQTVNIDNATIWGFELKGRMDWGRVGSGNLSMPFTLGQARGQDDGNGRPLNSVDPAMLTLGLHYATAAWTLRLDMRHHAAKNADDIDVTAGVKAGSFQFSDVPAATTLDLSGQWRIRKGLRLNAAIINLTDRKYWLWSDVQGLTAASATTQADAYTQPGRHVNVSLVMDF
ncbi:TonB-dependent hemoglobin/transferrin/lactoferrin family receptor [Curvibacter delicatus]|jgi:hemoglobin/transferrin/lactoferrin receptor protein|uniref:TonB-dependent hemoglobin/transferrin/lactoferrin family receptor n=1 Tax=Curvibacter delicatus TaxID=80879 RepID=UPI0009FD855E|nr:TonB-dependent hemoglobin/transferrin/lactoferrin family receptor [Curvibacter delicatus]